MRARILALSRQSPPPELGVTHWSSRPLASYLRREGVTVSHVFVADLWRENGVRPRQQGTFKLSSDPRFEEKVIPSSACTWRPRRVLWSSVSTRSRSESVPTSRSRCCR